MYRHLMLERVAVAVAPAKTIMVAPVNVTPALGALTIEVINDDPAQILEVRVERSHTQGGPWNTAPFPGFETIQPGEARQESLDVRYLEWMRLVGTASGAGLSARVTAILFSGED